MSRRKEEPTALRVIESTPLSNREAEQIITQCLESSEMGSGSTGAQLRRVQRDLRGLPPLLTNSTTGEVDVDMGDAPAEVSMVVDADESMQDEDDGTIDKEERKRRKKERRKEEKRLKAQAKAQEADS